MPINADIPEDLLPWDHRRALDEAAHLLISQTIDDLPDISQGGDFECASISQFLPRKFLGRYDASFARRFLVCLVVVSWKMKAPGQHLLSCVAEELAMHAIILQAEALLQTQGKEADFEDLHDYIFEDTDFEFLFDPRYDGIEDSEAGRELGMANLHFHEWFKPFRDEDPVHLFVADSDQGDSDSPLS